MLAAPSRAGDVLSRNPLGEAMCKSVSSIEMGQAHDLGDQGRGGMLANRRTQPTGGQFEQTGRDTALCAAHRCASYITLASSSISRCCVTSLPRPTTLQTTSSRPAARLTAIRLQPTDKAARSAT